MDLDGLVDLLTGELEAAIGETIASHSAKPAREFARRVIDTDLAMTDADDAGALGQSAAFLVLVTWLAAVQDTSAVRKKSAVREKSQDGALYGGALDWVSGTLGPACADTAHRAGTIVDAPDSPVAQRTIAELGEDFLPGLVWLATGMVAEHGNDDPAILRTHPGTG
jgi:hypothetical protein